MRPLISATFGVLLAALALSAPAHFGEAAALAQMPIHLRVNTVELSTSVFANNNFVFISAQDLSDFPDIGGLFVTIHGDGPDIGDFFFCSGEPASDSQLNVLPNATSGFVYFSSPGLSTFDADGNEIPCRDDISIIAACADSGTISDRSVANSTFEAFGSRTKLHVNRTFRAATCDVDVRLNGTVVVEQSDAAGGMSGQKTNVTASDG